MDSKNISSISKTSLVENEPVPVVNKDEEAGGESFDVRDVTFSIRNVEIFAQPANSFHNSTAASATDGMSIMTCGCAQCLGSQNINSQPTAQEFTLSSSPNYQQALFGDGASWTGVSGQAVTIQYALNATFADHPLGTGVNLSAAQQTAVREILGLWSTYTNVTFQEVAASSAELKFKNYDLAPGVAGVAYNWTYVGGDQIAQSVVSMDIAQTGFNQGEYGYLAYIHEVGHALGLKHPGNYNAGGGGAGSPYLTDFGLTDSRDYTVMSYYSGSYSDEPSTAMIYDIATIQTLYGANTSYNNTATTYTLNGNSKVWTIWDGGGTDTINSTAYSSAVTIDLREGASNASDIGSNNFWIAFGANIENITSGAGNDTLSGNSLANSITGGAGNDVINGYGGTDTVVFSGNYANYTVTIVNATTLTVVDNYVTDGNDGTDTLTAIEQLMFGSMLYGFNGVSITQLGMESIGGATVGNDTIYGNNNNNLILGGMGNDKLFGRAGNDSLDGGDGTDGLLGEAGDDTIDGGNGADDIYGGDGIDSINGGAANDTVRGGNGNDIINGDGENDYLLGEAGADNINGGLGIDTIYGGTENDTITGGVDNVSDGGDKIFGGAGDDSILGGGGADALNGEAGNDYINGESGNDIIYGGFGLDTLYGGDGNDNIYGQDDADTVYGGLGNDTISGNLGNDVLYGEAGGDKIYGNEGNDSIYGGLNADYMVGGTGADIFIFTATTDSPAASTIFDLIGDFSRAQGDKIDVSAFAGTMTFLGNSAYTGVAGQIQYKFDGTNTTVRIDTDGNRTHDVIFQLTGNIALLSSDFIL